MRLITLCFTLLMLVAGACKSDDAKPKRTVIKAEDKPRFEEEIAKEKKMEAARAQEQTAQTLQSNLQGRWKSETEKGVEYTFAGNKMTRIAGGKETIYEVNYSHTLGDLRCGGLPREFARLAVAGGLILTNNGKIECMLVVKSSPDRWEFVRTGVTNPTIETCNKI